MPLHEAVERCLTRAYSDLQTKGLPNKRATKEEATTNKPQAATSKSQHDERPAARSAPRNPTSKPPRAKVPSLPFLSAARSDPLQMPLSLPDSDVGEHQAVPLVKQTHNREGKRGGRDCPREHNLFTEGAERYNHFETSDLQGRAKCCNMKFTCMLSTFSETMCDH